MLEVEVLKDGSLIYVHVRPMMNAETRTYICVFRLRPRPNDHEEQSACSHADIWGLPGSLPVESFQKHMKWKWTVKRQIVAIKVHHTTYHQDNGIQRHQVDQRTVRKALHHHIVDPAPRALGDQVGPSNKKHNLQFCTDMTIETFVAGLPRIASSDISDEASKLRRVCPRQYNWEIEGKQHISKLHITNSSRKALIVASHWLPLRREGTSPCRRLPCLSMYLRTKPSRAPGRLRSASRLRWPPPIEQIWANPKSLEFSKNWIKKRNFTKDAVPAFCNHLIEQSLAIWPQSMPFCSRTIEGTHPKASGEYLSAICSTHKDKKDFNPISHSFQTHIDRCWILMNVFHPLIYLMAFCFQTKVFCQSSRCPENMDGAVRRSLQAVPQPTWFLLRNTI